MIKKTRRDLRDFSAIIMLCSSQSHCTSLCLSWFICQLSIRSAHSVFRVLKKERIEKCFLENTKLFECHLRVQRGWYLALKILKLVDKKVPNYIRCDSLESTRCARNLKLAKKIQQKATSFKFQFHQRLSELKSFDMKKDQKASHI